jgi:hypothetical protein
VLTQELWTAASVFPIEDPSFRLREALGTPSRAGRSSRMPRKVANKPTPEIEGRARAIVKALYEATDGRPMRWCILAFIRGDSDEALQYAVDRKWVIRGEGNTACLTDEGRKLITKGFN